MSEYPEYEDLPIEPCENCLADAEDCSQCPLLNQEEYEQQALDERRMLEWKTY